MSKKTFKKITALILTLILVVGIIPFGVSAASKTYYVSADGSSYNSGLSEDKPTSLEKINTTTLSEGDKIFFKRGDVFYGTFTPKLSYFFSGTADSQRIVIDAYGEGDLPIFSLAKITGDNWIDCGDGFWKYDLSNENNYTGVSNDFLAETDYANVGFFQTKDGKIYGRRFLNSEGCVENYSFYCDNSYIYIKLSDNPYSLLGELTLSMHGTLISMDKCLTFKNLHLKYGGYGFVQSRTKNSYITISDCIIECLGGSDIDSSDKFTRGGNGIELFDYANDVTVTNNIFRNIYDSGFTCQGFGYDVTENGSNYKKTLWNDVIVANNIFAYNTQAFEIWSNGTSSDSGINGLNFTNNLCIGQGEGWTKTFRSTERNSSVADILTYGFSPNLLNMNLTGNTYVHLKENPVFFAINLGTDTKFFDKVNYGVVSDYNYFYHLEEDSTAYLTNTNMAGVNFSNYQKKGQDTNSTFLAIGNDIENYIDLQTIAAKSYNFNDIVETANKTGILVNTNYDSNATTTTKLKNNIYLDEEIVGGTVDFDVTLKGNYSTINVTVTPDNGKKLMVNGLKYSLGENTFPIIKRVGAANKNGDFNYDSENQCNSFEFNVKNDVGNIVISASFVNEGCKNIAVVGTSVNREEYKLRFRSRAASTYIENGIKYTIKSCGTLLLKEEQADLSDTWEKIAFGHITGKNVRAQALYDRCDDYYEFVCHINYGNEDSKYFDDKYYAYAYAIYESRNGKEITLFSNDAVAYSYNEVSNIIDVIY